MKFREYIANHIMTLFLLIGIMVTIEIFLLIYNFGTFVKWYIPITIFCGYFLGCYLEFRKEKIFFEEIENHLEDLEEKYLIREVIQEPSFLEGKKLVRILQQTDKSMNEKVNQYKHKQEEYKEYIELWIHEIKLPIAASKMVVENNKNMATKRIDEELDKIERYVEQALFYARSNTVEKDYLLRKTNLKDVINEVIKKNKNEFIRQNIKIELMNLEQEVYTDSKWISFILQQIIGNSFKYFDKPERKIIIQASEQKEKVILSIKDNGMGIKENEVDRVWEKGFTGSNGRTAEKKSTGIGLYLCKKLCLKLGLGIQLESQEGKGTDVILIFPKDSRIQLT